MSGSDKKRTPRKPREASKQPAQPALGGAAFGGMMKNGWRLLALVILVAAGYFLWPRTPSLSVFEPGRMAQLQVDVWKKAKARHRWEMAAIFYRIYSGQYGCYPYASLKMAKFSADAVIVFRAAPDAADQEKAIEPLNKVFDLLTTQTKATFDPYAAAQMELQIWSLRANGGRQAELTTALSEQLALVHGKPSEDCLPAAKKFVLAMRAADKGQWSESVLQDKEAWAKLKPLAK